MTAKITLLALDTSTLFASAALFSDGELVGARVERVTTHSDRLLVVIRDLLAEAHLHPRDLQAIACGAGPGSFTGLRIGLATAKGLAFAGGLPLVMISSLAGLAARGEGETLALIDAHKGEVYAGKFMVDNNVPVALGPEEAIAPALLAERLAGSPPLALVGDGVARYPELLRPPHRRVDDEPGPHGADIGRLALERLLRGESDPLATAAPRYIRPSEAEIMKAKREQR